MMEKAILDVCTTIKSKETQCLTWEIKEIGLSLNSQAIQLSQEFGPLTVDNLKFGLRIRKLSVGNVEFRVFSLNSKDADLGLLRIIPSVSGRAFPEFVLDFYDRSFYQCDLLSAHLNTTISLKLEMFYENVQVRTQILNKASSKNSDQTQDVSPKTFPSTSFDIVGSVSDPDQTNGKSQFGKAKIVKSNYESDNRQNASNKSTLYSWVESGNWAEDEGEKAVGDQDSDDELQTVFNESHKDHKDHPVQSSKSSKSINEKPTVSRKTIKHFHNPRNEIETSDSQPEVSRFNHKTIKCDMEDSEDEPERIKGHEGFEIDWDVPDYTLPSTTFEVEPGSKIKVLQDVIQVLHQDLHERIILIVNGYLKGDSTVLSHTMKSDDKLFDLILDLETLFNGFEELIDDVDVDVMDNYLLYVNALKKWFETNYSNRAKLQMDIFQQIQLHFQTLSNAKNLCIDMKALIAEYEKIDGTNFSYSNTSKMDAHMEELEQRFNELDLKADGMERSVNNLLIQDFIDMKHVRSNYMKLLQLYANNKRDESQFEPYFNDEPAFQQESIFKQEGSIFKKKVSVFNTESKSIKPIEPACIYASDPEPYKEASSNEFSAKTAIKKSKSVEPACIYESDPIEEVNEDPIYESDPESHNEVNEDPIEEVNEAENGKIQSLGGLLKLLIGQVNELEWYSDKEKLDNIKDMKPVMDKLAKKVEKISKQELSLSNREYFNGIKEANENLQERFSSLCEELVDEVFGESLDRLKYTMDRVADTLHKLGVENADDGIKKCYVDLENSIKELDTALKQTDESLTHNCFETKSKANELLSDLSNQLKSWQEFKKVLSSASSEQSSISILLNRIEDIGDGDLNEDSQIEEDVEALEVAQSETIDRIEGLIRKARKFCNQESSPLISQAREKIIKVDKDHLILMTRLGQAQEILQKKRNKVTDYVSEDSD